MFLAPEKNILADHCANFAQVKAIQAISNIKLFFARSIVAVILWPGDEQCARE